jgi:cysteine-rich repeat protein
MLECIDNKCLKCDDNGANCNQCIEGFQVSKRKDCIEINYCGDDILQQQEECDDGNILPNDGCNPNC